ncbi:MAG: YesL family protein [Mobilitalea sp.]
MSNFFNMDNPVFTFLGKACDVIFLSVVYLLLCVPIVTIGPATTALYYATVKVLRRERGYLFREFFKSFKLNFKRASFIGLILFIMYLILAIDIMATYSSWNGENTMNSVLFGIYIAIAFMLSFVTIYIFPVLSRFEMKTKQLIKTVFLIAIKHLPFTLLMLIIQAAIIVGVMFLPIVIFIAPVTSAFMTSIFMERILKKYMPPADESEENSGLDQWYLE